MIDMIEKKNTVYEIIVTTEGAGSKTITDDVTAASDTMVSYVGTSMSATLVNGITGAVLTTVKEGNVTYISSEFREQMVKSTARTHPEAVKSLLQAEALLTLFDPNGGEEEFVSVMNLMTEVFGIIEAMMFVMDVMGMVDDFAGE